MRHINRVTSVLNLKRINIQKLKIPVSGIVTVTLSILLSFLFASFSSAESNKLKSLDGMTLMEFINYTSERLDETMVISPRVRTNRKVTIYSPEKVNDQMLREIFNTVLEMHGYGAVEVGGVTRIVRDRKMRSMPLPVIEG